MKFFPGLYYRGPALPGKLGGWAETDDGIIPARLFTALSAHIESLLALERLNLSEGVLHALDVGMSDKHHKYRTKERIRILTALAYPTIEEGAHAD